eukprot:2912024-Heterocapsa_arctica.AAC.1
MSFRTACMPFLSRCFCIPSCHFVPATERLHPVSMIILISSDHRTSVVMNVLLILRVILSMLKTFVSQRQQ